MSSVSRPRSKEYIEDNSSSSDEEEVRSMSSPKGPITLTDGVDTIATVAPSVKPILHFGGKNLSMVRQLNKQSSSSSSSDSDSEDSETAKNNAPTSGDTANVRSSGDSEDKSSSDSKNRSSSDNEDSEDEQWFHKNRHDAPNWIGHQKTSPSKR